MYRGTTPTLIFKLKNTTLDLTTLRQVWVTMRDDRNRQDTWDISRVTFDNDEKTISLALTQEETLAFHGGTARIQIRMLTDTGAAPITNIVECELNAILKGGVIK